MEDISITNNFRPEYFYIINYTLSLNYTVYIIYYTGCPRKKCLKDLAQRGYYGIKSFVKTNTFLKWNVKKSCETVPVDNSINVLLKNSND